MLDLRYVSEHGAEAKAALIRRGYLDFAVLDRVELLANERRAVIASLESFRQRLNAANDEMSRIRDKSSSEFTTRRDSLRELGSSIKESELALARVEAELDAILLVLPNLPHAETPDGSSENDNPVMRVVGTKPTFEFPVRDHVELGTALGVLDFERAAKISGARFSVLRGGGAQFMRALLQFMLDLHTREHGYEEVWVPALVKDSALLGTGQLPKFEADVFRIALTDGAGAGDEAARKLYLIPTAEVPITNLHADEVLDGALLPIKYTGYTPCFRSEAGSYGKDTRGMIRQHQFDKVELVNFVHPDHARKALEELTLCAEKVLQRLGLHYRVVQLCAGDIGFSAQMTYDLEVWLPAQDAFREISSCSWFGDFQARRAKIRFKPDAKQKPQLVHTLNGSGLAIGRTLVAILEQYQQADGSIRVPDALVPYMGGMTTLRANG